MKESAVFPLMVFYDGACSVCAREMAHYRKLDRAGQLQFVDISEPGFAPEEYGKTREQFMARMHVMDAGGSFFFGVDAFPVIWQALPGWPTWGTGFLPGIAGFCPGQRRPAAMGAAIWGIHNNKRAGS